MYRRPQPSASQGLKASRSSLCSEQPMAGTDVFKLTRREIAIPGQPRTGNLCHFSRPGGLFVAFERRQERPPLRRRVRTPRVHHLGELGTEREVAGPQGIARPVTGFRGTSRGGAAPRVHSACQFSRCRARPRGRFAFYVSQRPPARPRRLLLQYVPARIDRRGPGEGVLHRQGSSPQTGGGGGDGRHRPPVRTIRIAVTRSRGRRQLLDRRRPEDRGQRIPPKDHHRGGRQCDLGPCGAGL